MPREDIKAYSNPDNDPNGPWKPDPIYANNPYTLDGEITQVILDLIMETYLFWIVPFLYIYWKLTQLLYHYLNRKIDEKITYKLGAYKCTLDII